MIHPAFLQPPAEDLRQQTILFPPGSPSSLFMCRWISFLRIKDHVQELANLANLLIAAITFAMDRGVLG